jgi:UDP-GlcNAc:undecaprenyl-phosphate GlcNAc-1-phosphate transferase
MPPIGWYVVIVAVAAAVTAAATLPARWISLKVGYVAPLGDRSIHSRVTPYGGGAAMFLGFLVAMCVAATIPALHNVFANSSEPLGVVLAAGAIFAVGLIDDVRDMSAPAKMAGQVLAASILYFLGVTMYQFKVPVYGLVALGPSITPLMTALWVIAITNAVNLIDGLDGLAAGVVAIGGGALAVYGLRLMEQGLLPTDNIGPLVAALACGVCLGFLPFNFHPARIFMGDAGALFLGLLMAASTMVIGGRQLEGSGTTFFFFAPLIIPLFILGVPLVDMAFAFVRRTVRGTGFHTPDKDHIHHRLLRLGHGHRRSVLILWAWTALLSGFLLFPLFESRVNAFIPFGVAALGIALYTFFHPGLRQKDAAGEPVPVGAGASPAEGTAGRSTDTGAAPDRSSGDPNGVPGRAPAPVVDQPKEVPAAPVTSARGPARGQVRAPATGVGGEAGRPRGPVAGEPPDRFAGH